MLTVFNLIRFGAAIVRWEWVLAFMPAPGPFYILLTGLSWAAAWFAAFLSLYFRPRWARWYIFALAILYTVYYWADRIFFQNAVPRRDLPFTAVENILFLTFIVVTLFLPRHRAYFIPDPTQERAQNPSGFKKVPMEKEGTHPEKSNQKGVR